MFLNQTTKYTLRVLIEMAKDRDHTYSAQALHKKLDIPRRYLMRLLTDLTSRGYIISHRGRDGGFRLAKNPDDLFLTEIIDEFEGLKNYSVCFFGNADCVDMHTGHCGMHDPWQNAWKSIYNALKTTSIGQLHLHENGALKGIL